MQRLRYADPEKHKLRRFKGRELFKASLGYQDHIYLYKYMGTWEYTHYEKLKVSNTDVCHRDRTGETG